MKKSKNALPKVLVIVVVPNTKQTNWLYEQYHVKIWSCFYRKIYDLFPSHVEKTENLRQIWIWEILEDHVLEIIYM